MESLSDSDTETIVVIEDTKMITIVGDTDVVDIRTTPRRRVGDLPPGSSFADDPFVVDWAPPQS